MNIPNISVIIPVYKAEEFFEKCLYSLFNQNLKEIEFVFVDDKTPDESFKVLDKVLSKYPERRDWIKIINNNENLGSGATRNIGLSAASGEYITFCDSDDWCDLDLYDKMYQAAKSSDADIVCCNIWHEYTNHRFCSNYEYKVETVQSLYDLKLDLLYSSLCNKLIKRSLYSTYNITFYKGINKWEDLGVITRLRYYSKKTIIIDDSFYHYNKLNSNSIVTVPSIKKIEEQLNCAMLLNDFFNDKGNSFQMLSNYIKFISKIDLLWIKQIRDKKRWKRTFEETNKHIWDYKILSFNMRLIFWLAINNCTNLACFLIDLKQAIYNMNRK